MAGWEQIAIIITVVAGLFLWLRADIKRLEDKLERKIDTGFKSMDDRLTQSRNRTGADGGFA